MPSWPFNLTFFPMPFLLPCIRATCSNKHPLFCCTNCNWMVRPAIIGVPHCTELPKVRGWGEFWVITFHQGSDLGRCGRVWLCCFTLKGRTTKCCAWVQACVCSVCLVYFAESKCDTMNYGSCFLYMQKDSNKWFGWHANVKYWTTLSSNIASLYSDS